MFSVLRNRMVVGKLTAVLLAVPILLYAYASGPDPRNTGAPGDTTCNKAGCHVGTNLNAGPGSVKITFPGDMTYTPGVKQRLIVTVADPGQRLGIDAAPDR